MSISPFVGFISAPYLRKSALIAVAAFVVSACSTLSPTTGNQGLVSAADRTYNKAIELDGRLSVQYERNGDDESVHGSFSWRQSPQRSVITLLSPLGQIIATIDVSADSATLTQSGHVSRTAPDVDELALQSLGWPLPVSGLRDWLQGFAMDADGNPFVATPSADRVVTRDGWDLRYVTWDDTNPSNVHPKRIDLTRNTAQAGKVVLRIVIDKWQPA